MLKSISAVVLLILTLLFVVAPASAAVCGFYESTDWAYYNHCGPTKVRVFVQMTWARSTEICVNPWEDRVIGRADDIVNAWYTGLC